jgi:hypothetical protein
MSAFGCRIGAVVGRRLADGRIERVVIPPKQDAAGGWRITRPGWGFGAWVGRSYPRGAVRQAVRKAAGWGLAVALALTGPSAFAAEEPEREPVTLKVVAVNPSSDKRQSVPVKIDLPQEVKPTDILSKGDLELEFDDDRSLYYVHKPAVELAPKETRVFEVTVRDVWFVPEAELGSLTDYTDLLLVRLEKSDYAVTAKQLGDSIKERLGQIRTTQNDETLSRKARIGAYRQHLQVVAQIKEDLARMEKLLTFVGGPPALEMLDESPLKSDSPSRTTTWVVIFLVVIFLGLLAGQFFFTWHGRTKVPEANPAARQAFGARPGVQQPAGNGARAGADDLKPRSPRLN